MNIKLIILTVFFTLISSLSISCVNFKFNKQVNKVNNYLSHYSSISAYGDDFIHLDTKKLGFTKKEIEEIKQEDYEFTKNKDSIDNFSLISIYQDKIFKGIENILSHKNLVNSKLNSLFNEELTVVSSPDNQLFNFSLDEKTGGTYRSRISLMYYSKTNSILQSDFFASDGYGIIDTIHSNSGVKYLLQGFVRGCSWCYSSHISLIQYRDNEWKQDFYYSFETRDFNDDIELDSTKQKLTGTYHLSDLSENCICNEYSESNDFEYTIEKHILCTCIFIFNGETYELMEKKEKVDHSKN